MNRAIKFRVWDTYHQKMTDSFFMFDLRDNEYVYYESWRDFEDGRFLPCKVMRFTGLYDCEGRDVWEGDLVEIQNESTITKKEYWYPVFIIEHDGWSFTLKYLKGGLNSDCTFHVRHWKECKVIGNIYEHPNLLSNES